MLQALYPQSGEDQAGIAGRTFSQLLWSTWKQQVSPLRFPSGTEGKTPVEMTAQQFLKCR